MRALQDEVFDLDFISSHSAQKIKELEHEVVIRDKKILEITSAKATVSVVGKLVEYTGVLLGCRPPTCMLYKVI